MGVFADEMQRRLRAVLSARANVPVPDGALVTIERAEPDDEAAGGIEILATFSTGYAGISAAHTYEGAAAWALLLADLDAVPDAARLALVKVVQTCPSCPSQWDAWGADGQRYYLRYRFGRGTVQLVTETTTDGAMEALADDLTAEFRYGDNLDGTISLADFARLARLDITRAALFEHAGPVYAVTFGGVVAAVSDPPAGQARNNQVSDLRDATTDEGAR